MGYPDMIKGRTPKRPVTILAFTNVVLCTCPVVGIFLLRVFKKNFDVYFFCFLHVYSFVFFYVLIMID